ncbi:flavodoxin domain-containing protein [Nonomuraea sp. NPDC050310]|uniref:flavodoxin family protein n=1 Tax=Nonomuraea sp. NPDC050310 TaxID=3154935 RepID=UPI0033C4A823
MRALVIYESMFGNTRAIAEAIGRGLARNMPADVVEVGVAPDTVAEDVSILVIGGPTHAFGMSRPSTRRSAAEQALGELVSQSRGMREWLATASVPLTAATAFDTRVGKPRLPGSAAKGALRRLRRLGLGLAAPAESFYVGGTLGPLAEGELARAQAWGEHLAVSVRSAASRP